MKNNKVYLYIFDFRNNGPIETKYPMYLHETNKYDESMMYASNIDKEQYPVLAKEGELYFKYNGNIPIGIVWYREPSIAEASRAFIKGVDLLVERFMNHLKYIDIDMNTVLKSKERLSSECN